MKRKKRPFDKTHNPLRVPAAPHADPEGIFERALALHQAHRFNEAEACYRRLLLLTPDNVPALSNLGTALDQQGRFGDATATFERALRIQPDHPNALVGWATSLQNAGLWREAETAWQKSLAVNGSSAALHCNLGLVLHQLGQDDSAIAAFRQALDHEPDSIAATGNLAKLLQSLGRFVEAETAYRRAIDLAPLSSEFHAGLSAAIMGQCRLGDEVALARRAVELDPSNGLAHVTLGQAFVQGNHLDDAIAAFEEGLRLRPGDAEAQVSLAQARLAKGDFSRGWGGYEWRWKARVNQSHVYHTLSHPIWQGDSLDGLTILLHQEQGMGDNIQFVRYVPSLLAVGAKVILAAPASLHRLFGSISGVTMLTLDPPPPPFHVRASLMSLPHLFGTSLATIPASVPYLGVAEPDVRRWQANLGPGGLNVGLVWAGNPRHANDRNRSLPLAVLAPLLRLPHVRWFSLQKEPPAQDLATLADLGDVVTPLPIEDFYDTAAALSALDLVISVDTSVCHLAGALGRPVWVMLPFAAEWRWMLDREDSPWYPSMRLFRQSAPGAWEGVVERIGRRIRTLAAARR